MNESLSTPEQTYHVGQTYLLHEQIAAMWEVSGIATPTETPPEYIARFYARLNEGAGKPCIFTPHLGEFGHQIISGIRLVHWHKASEKVVCCREGEQVLFPSASSFVTDWTSPPEYRDATTAGSMRSPVEMWGTITSRYPKHLPIEQGGLSHIQELLPIHPSERIPFSPRRRGLRADVLIGIRNRAFHTQKNYPHWQTIADALRAEGRTYAVIGDRATSLQLDGMEWHSGDYDTDAAIEAMQEPGTVYVGTCTGSAHLSAAVGCSMIIIREQWFGRDFGPIMETYNPGRIETLTNVWENPGEVIAAILAAATTRHRTG